MMCDISINTPLITQNENATTANGIPLYRNNPVVRPEIKFAEQDGNREIDGDSHDTQ